MGIDAWGGVGWVFSDTAIAERVCHTIVYFIQSHSSLVLFKTLQIPTRNVCTGRK